MVLIGAGVASMCAAAVLSRRGCSVTLIERDTLADGVSARAGIPQARHIHVLLQSGWMEMERLFPGFQARMLEAGAHLFDPAQASALRRPSGWQRNMRSGVVNALASRDLTESIIRGLLRAMPGVEMKDGLDVVDLRAVKGRNRVLGVRAKEREGGALIDFDADLVLDGSGKASKAPAWLEAMGVSAPKETVVDSFAGYASRWYKATLPEKRPGGRVFQAIWIDPVPPSHPLGAALFPIEGDRWIVTIFGHGKCYPPSDIEGFQKALSGLASSLIAATVADAEPLSPVVSARSHMNRFRRYERSSNMPAGFVAIGDSVCVFNPIYGQGMTVAALASGALSTVLERGEVMGSASFVRAFYEEQARLFADPWALATGADFRYPETVGDKPPGADLLRGYGDLLAACSLEDETLLQQTWPVFHMLKPVKELAAPRVFARVLLLSLAAKTRALVKGVEAIPPMPPE